jgi:hypothetical protein
MNRTHIQPGSGTIAVTPAVLLRAAADHIAAHGWHRGSLYDYNRGRHLLWQPAVCALGALYLAAHGRRAVMGCIDPPSPALREAFRYLVGYLIAERQLDTDREDTRSWERLLADWNDDPARLAADVTTALREAADIWSRVHPDGGVA